MLSDRHGAALVTRDGSVGTGSAPRGSTARRSLPGCSVTTPAYWSVRAAGAIAVTRRYLDRTMVLETTDCMASGTVVVDALAMGWAKGPRARRDAPHLLLRQVTCTHGEVDVDVELLRTEYGLVYVARRRRRWLVAIGGPDVLVVLLAAVTIPTFVGLRSGPPPAWRRRRPRPAPQPAGRR